MTETAGCKLQQKNDMCKWDGNLQVNPAASSWEPSVINQSGNPIPHFPYLKVFIKFACIAYKTHVDVINSSQRSKRARTTDAGDEVEISSLLQLLRLEDSDLEDIPEGYQFLAKANNRSTANGYHGVAFINRENRQIVLSHRGTKLTNVGALITDIKGVLYKSYTSQVSSAITFAYQVAQFVQQNNYQLFFTGHSLGAWLAQITCFTTKFLTLNNNSGHFVKKPCDLWDDIHPYTVVFDSPGALEFLRKMRDDLFPLNEAQSQMRVNVACLPVEVFQFYPNSVNAVNTQVGSVYIVDLDKTEVQISYTLVKVKVGGIELSVPKPLSSESHSLKPVEDLITKNVTGSEEEVVRCCVVDWRIGKWDDFLHKWEKEGRSVPIKLNVFPSYFLTGRELEVLKEQVGKSESGCYEGLSLAQEETAARVVKFTRGIQIVDKGMVNFGVNVDRREVIPLVRHFVKALISRSIWWNPRKFTLPLNYIQRRIRRTRYSNDYPTGIKSTHLGSKESIKQIADEKFLFLVDPPGMGKSSEVTDLEQKLRKEVTRDRIILRVNLNEVQRELSTITEGESAARILIKLAPFVPFESVQMDSLRVFVLLDGLDEVCPTHQETMLTLLTIIHSENERTDVRIVLSARPHLRQPVMSAFNVESWSLVRIEREQRDAYMAATLRMSSQQFKNSYRRISLRFRDLLGNPLMLSMFTDVLKSKPSLTISDLNTFDLYTRFVDEKHKLLLLEKEGMGAENNMTKIRVETMLLRNLQYYNFFAFCQLVLKEGDKCIPPAFRDSMGTVAEKYPQQTILDELLSYGLLVQREKNTRPVFQHRSFAEFFYARFLLHVETPQAMRDSLFGYMYANDMSNTEKFVFEFLSRENVEVSLFPVTTEWLHFKADGGRKESTISNFFNGKLFPYFVRSMLVGLIRGDPTQLRDVFELLVSKKDNFRKIYQWMNQNSPWARDLLSPSFRNYKKVYPPVARLIVATALMFECQTLFNRNEVTMAMDSCGNLISTVAAIEGLDCDLLMNFLGGRKFKEAVRKTNDEDFYKITCHLALTLKVIEAFSHEELLSLITLEKTRVTDMVGVKPELVLFVFGEEFLGDLVKFRGKYGDKKGKSVFELSGKNFALDYLFNDLMKEAEKKDINGPVTVALRKAIRRESSWELLPKLEKLIMHSRKCSCDLTNVDLFDWVINAGGSLWNLVNSTSLETLPFFVRYSGSHNHVQKIIDHNDSSKIEGNKGSAELLFVSLILASLSTEDSSPSAFSHLVALIEKRFPNPNEKIGSLIRPFLEAEESGLIGVTQYRPLVSDISVQHINFLLAQPTSTFSVDIPSVKFVSGVIKFTPCRLLPTALHTLKRLPRNSLEKILLDDVVLRNWKDLNKCALRNLFSFYFEIFGVNLDWISGKSKKFLVRRFVEKLEVLEANPFLNHLVPEYEMLLTRSLVQLGIRNVAMAAELLPYKTVREWERLLRIIKDEYLCSDCAGKECIPKEVAVPLVRALINTFGVIKARVSAELLLEDVIPDGSFDDHSLETNASFLQIAIELGKLDWVKKLALPGLLLWKNKEGRTALEFIKENLEENHSISIYLRGHINLLKKYLVGK